MPPFLMTAFLVHESETVLAQDPNNFFRGANRKSLAHVSATFNTFAPLRNFTGTGSNQTCNASFALRTASSSVSPAEAHPGSSGKNADQRFVSASCSTTRRSFIATMILRSLAYRKPDARSRSRLTMFAVAPLRCQVGTLELAVAAKGRSDDRIHQGSAVIDAPLQKTSSLGVSPKY